MFCLPSPFRSPPIGAPALDSLAIKREGQGMDSMPFTLRPGLPQDATLIRDFVRAAYAKWVPVMGREPLPMTADYDAALQQHRFDLAFDGTELAALIETAVKDDHLWVENIAVRSDLQGRGLGQRLLRLAEDQARAAGVAEVRLLTNAALTGNVQFYQTYGFAITATEPFRGGFVVWFAKAV
jgi:GNAT superfamily N-acetyltransferase